MSDFIRSIIQRAVGSETDNMVMPYVTPSFVPKLAVSFNEPVTGQEEQVENASNISDYPVTSDKHISTSNSINITKPFTHQSEQTIQRPDKTQDIKALDYNEIKPTNGIGNINLLKQDNTPIKKVEDHNKLRSNEPSIKNEDINKQPVDESRNSITNNTTEKDVIQHAGKKTPKSGEEKKSVQVQLSEPGKQKTSLLEGNTSAEKIREKEIIKEPAATKYSIKKIPIIKHFLLQEKESEKTSSIR